MTDIIKIERIITPSCRFDCEMIIGHDALMTEENTEEIRKIYDESLLFIGVNQYHCVSVSDFKNAAGQTIGEFLLNKHEKFAISLSETE